MNVDKKVRIDRLVTRVIIANAKDSRYTRDAEPKRG